MAGFLAHLGTHGVESRSAARKLSCLRGFYRWLLLDKRIERDPTINLDSPSSWKVLPKSLAQSEVSEMLERAGVAADHPEADAIALRDRAILELLYAGGLRVSELTGLNVADLSLDAGRVLVRGKGDKERIVPLGRAAVEAIEKYLDAGPSGAPEERSRRGPTLSLRARRTTHTPMDLASGEVDGRPRQPAHAAPQLRDAHGRAWRRPAHRADPARPRGYRDDAGLHASGAGTAQGRPPAAPSSREESSRMSDRSLITLRVDEFLGRLAHERGSLSAHLTCLQPRTARIC